MSHYNLQLHIHTCTCINCKYLVNFRLSIFSVVELVIIIVNALLDFAVAVVISTGLHHTCIALEKSSAENLNLPYVTISFP